MIRGPRPWEDNSEYNKHIEELEKRILIILNLIEVKKCNCCTNIIWNQPEINNQEKLTKNQESGKSNQKSTIKKNQPEINNQEKLNGNQQDPVA